MSMKSLVRFVLLTAAAAAAVPAFASTPMPEVGSAAPSVDLPAADGSRASLAAIDGPRVVIFYRGLW
jgi:hypothetical protein